VKDELKYHIALLFSLLYSIIVIMTCCCFEKRFFIIDDAVNEALGSFMQYGKIWSAGYVPLIVDSMLAGGNGVMELSRGLFVPQHIVASILAYNFSSMYLSALFLALFNITLICFSGLSIAKSIRLSPLSAYLFAAFISIQPVFLYIFCASWWGAASSFAWATASIATFLLLQEKSSMLNVFLNFFSTLILLCTTWPQFIVGYGVVVLVSLIFYSRHEMKYKQALLSVLPGICALLFALPLYTEYLISIDLINRPSGWNNHGRFLSPAWSSILMGFSPAYYEFFNFFGGYRLMLVPLGFSTVFFPSVFFYRKIGSLWKTDWRLQWMGTIVIVFFLLTQMPTQFSQLRYSFRFLPFLSLALCLLTFYVLDKGERVINKQWYYYIFISIVLFLSVSVSLGAGHKYIVLQIFSCVLLLFCPAIIEKITQKKISKLLVLIIPYLSLLIMLMGLPTLGSIYLPFPKLTNTLSIPKEINLSGYILSLTPGWDNKRWNWSIDVRSLNDLYGAQFGIYNIKSVNGYTPIGHKYFDRLLPNYSTQVMFNPSKALDNILIMDSKYNICKTQLFRISSIALTGQDFSRFRNKLALCGYTEVTQITRSNNKEVFASLPQGQTHGWELSPPYVFPQTVQTKVQLHTNNQDTITIPEHEQNIELIFPRVWWPGYSAKYNNLTIPVKTDDSGVLLKVNLPEGKEGVLILSYFPYTWRYLWFLPILSMIGLGLLLLYMRHKHTNETRNFSISCGKFRFLKSKMP